MGEKHTLEELNKCSREELITFVLMMQVRIANNYRFGKHTETLSSIDGHLSFFDEADAICDVT